MRIKYKRTEKYDPVAIEREEHGKLMRGITAVVLRDSWTDYDEELSMVVRKMDPLRFANIELGDVGADGVMVGGQLVTPDKVIWSITQGYHIREDMPFEDVLYLDHVLGREQ